jgi:hypothetical protein
MHVIWIASSSKRGKIGKGGISEIDRFVGSRIFVPSLPSLLKCQPIADLRSQWRIRDLTRSQCTGTRGKELTTRMSLFPKGVIAECVDEVFFPDVLVKVEMKVQVL